MPTAQRCAQIRKRIDDLEREIDTLLDELAAPDTAAGRHLAVVRPAGAGAIHSIRATA